MIVEHTEAVSRRDILHTEVNTSVLDFQAMNIA